MPTMQVKSPDIDETKYLVGVTFPPRMSKNLIVKLNNWNRERERERKRKRRGGLIKRELSWGVSQKKS